MAADDGPGGHRPVPDPTTLTTDQLRREIHGLRELMESRFNARDRADEVLERTVAEQAKLAEQAVGHLKALHDERFLSVAQQFQERDIRDKMTSESQREAIKAALEAQKSLNDQQNTFNSASAGRVEQSLSKQLDQISQLAQAGRDALAEQVSALKERVDKGEGSTVGSAEYRTERRLDLGQVVAVVAVIVAVLSVVLYALKK